METSGQSMMDDLNLFAGSESETWALTLYVAGQSPKSLQAFANLKKVCEKFIPGKYSIEVIDLAKNPQLAAEHHIFAIPTLIRKTPEPLRRIVGDLSSDERTISGLELQLASASR